MKKQFLQSTSIATVALSAFVFVAPASARNLSTSDKDAQPVEQQAPVADASKDAPDTRGSQHINQPPVADNTGEIIVTAEKRAQSLQRVPISVTALSGETLTAVGIANVEDLQFFVPGMSITNDSMAIINIRGIGTSAFGVATDPSTTVHYDGVYISRPTTLYQDLFDVERVEILRGPQGVLFGRNSAGGTMNIISKDPTNTLTGAVGVTVGNYNRRQLSGTISGPLATGVTARATFVRTVRDGIYHDAVTGREYQDEDNIAGRATIAIKPNDALEIVLRGDANRSDETGSVAVRLSYPPQFALAGATIPQKSDQIALDTVPVNNVKTRGVSSTISYDAGPVLLRSITAYRSSDIAQRLDVDATDLFLRNIEFYEKAKTFTQELQILSDTGGPLTWILGGFYLNEKGNDEIRILEPGRTLIIPESNTTNAYAVFGQATYSLTDRARLTAGLRYSYEKKDFAYRVFSGGSEVDAAQPKSSWKAWTPKFVGEYDLTKNVMAYASATRGFKSGGFQLGDGRPFLPEYLWSYEAGLKSRLFNRRLRANLSGFYYNYTNLQVVEYINGVATTTNAGKATIKGIEAEFGARVTDQLELSSTLAYLDAKYDVYFDQGVSFKGNRLPNAPKWNITFGGEYTVPLGDAGRLLIRGDLAYRSNVYFKANNLPQFAQHDTTLLNGRITYKPRSENWEFALYGRNLTDVRYTTYKTVGTDATGVSNPSLPLAVFGEPRQFGVQARYIF